MKSKKILYSIQTTGMGHVTRSMEIINLLKSEGHDIDILVSGQNYQGDFGCEIKYRFAGMSFDTEKKIDIKNLFLNNHPIQVCKDIYNLDLNPYDLIITDFEPITSWKGLLTGKKVLGIGNHYKFFETRLTLRPSFLINKFLCWLASPVRDYIGFDYIKSPNRKILNPIIKGNISNKGVTTGDYYITYLHNYSPDEQVEFFKKYPNEKFKIFAKVEESIQIENCQIVPLNNETFTKDILECKGVITNAGFQTTSECLYLGKKMWIIPIQNQIEQYYNCSILRELGVRCGYSLNDDDFTRLNATDYRIKIYYESDTMDRVLKRINDRLGIK